MTAIELWGTVVPAWISGVGGLAAAVVSTIALVLSLRTQGGMKTLTDAANVADTDGQTPRATLTPGHTPAVSPVSWTAWQETRHRYRLRNDSIHNGASATLASFRDVTPGGDEAASTAVQLPVTLAANETIPFTIEKSLVSPSVTAIELGWTDGDGTPRTRVLYI